MPPVTSCPCAGGTPKPLQTISETSDTSHGHAARCEARHPAGSCCQHTRCGLDIAGPPHWNTLLPTTLSASYALLPRCVLAINLRAETLTACHPHHRPVRPSASPSPNFPVRSAVAGSAPMSSRMNAKGCSKTSPPRQLFSWETPCQGHRVRLESSGHGRDVVSEALGSAPARARDMQTHSRHPASARQ
jgi:hypothetical protein